MGINYCDRCDEMDDLYSSDYGYLCQGCHEMLEVADSTCEGCHKVFPKTKDIWPTRWGKLCERCHEMKEREFEGSQYEKICAWCCQSITYKEQVNRESKRYRVASHGICKTCKDKELAKWGL